MSAQRVKLTDVARAAGVSTASASRALRDPQSVSEGLRLRILAAAGRLGYVPDPAARALATRRTGLVGFLVDSVAELLTGAFVDALDEALRHAGYGLMFSCAGATGIHELLRRGADALLSLDVPPSTDAERAAADQGKPWLMLHQEKAFSCAAGWALGCRYLLSLGHERLGVVAEKHRGIEAAARETLAGTGAELIALEPLRDLDPLLAAQQGAAALLDRADRPTGIICAGDGEALAALRECRTRGIDVPAQISIIGFGDTELARQAWPSLTTVRVAIPELARRAADAVVAMLAQETPSAPEAAVKLVVRESTAPAPGR